MYLLMFLFSYSWPNNPAGLWCFITACNRGTRETMLPCRTSTFCSTASSDWRKPNKRANVSLFNSVSGERAAPLWMPLFSERYRAPSQHRLRKSLLFNTWFVLMAAAGEAEVYCAAKLPPWQTNGGNNGLHFFFFTVAEMFHPKEIYKWRPFFFIGFTMLIVETKHTRM